MWLSGHLFVICPIPTNTPFFGFWKFGSSLKNLLCVVYVQYSSLMPSVNCKPLMANTEQQFPRVPPRMFSSSGTVFLFAQPSVILQSIYRKIWAWREQRSFSQRDFISHRVLVFGEHSRARSRRDFPLVVFFAPSWWQITFLARSFCLPGQHLQTAARGAQHFAFDSDLFLEKNACRYHQIIFHVQPALVH